MTAMNDTNKIDHKPWFVVKEAASYRGFLLDHGWTLHSVDTGDDVWQGIVETWAKPGTDITLQLLINRHDTGTYIGWKRNGRSYSGSVLDDDFRAVAEDYSLFDVEMTW